MRSVVCRYEHFLENWYVRQRDLLHLDQHVFHRKMWEWAIIVQALEDRKMLEYGKKAIGFAVGTEPLPSFFASKGIEVLATDFHEEGRWEGQHASGLDDLFKPYLVNEAEFRSRVSFQPADMNQIGDLPSEAYDFLWSSCAIEHVGSLDLSKAFVLNAMRLLKPGGVAVHTTEFNCSSNDTTIEVGPDVIWRRRDIEELEGRLRLLRCGMEPPDFDCGTDRQDLDYDEPPYYTKPHVKILVGDYVATSFLMVIHKA